MIEIRTFVLLGAFVAASLVGLTTHAQTLPKGVTNAPPTVIGNDRSIGSASTLNVSNGGVVGDRFIAHFGSTVNVSGGTVGNDFLGGSGSTLNVTGGAFGQGFRSGATTKISGGTFGSDFDIVGANGQLIGGEFLINGAPAGSSALVFGSDVMTGTLQDGTVFILSPLAGDGLGIVGVSLMNAALPPPPASPMIVASASALKGLRQGSSLTVVAGGALKKDFAAVSSTLNIAGGEVDDGLEVVDSLVNISGGSVGMGFHAFSGSIVNITGGYVDGGTTESGFRAYNGSRVNISGGEIGWFASAEAGSRLDITGGRLGIGATFNSGSVTNISGGIFEGFNAIAGSEVTVAGGLMGRGVQVLAGSNVSFLGGEFLLNGVAPAASMVTLGPLDTLTGTFANGTPFVFTPRWQDAIADVQLVSAALPPRDETPITVNSAVAPHGLRRGQSLTLLNGGELEDSFAMVEATLNVAGGFAGRGLKAIDSEITVSGGLAVVLNLIDSRLNLAGGEVFAVNALAGSEVRISAGKMTSNLNLWDGSTLVMTGGSAEYVWANPGSRVDVSGGVVTTRLELASVSHAAVTGGLVDSLVVHNGSTVEFSGGVIERMSMDVNSYAEIKGNAHGALGGVGGTVDFRGGTLERIGSISAGGVVNMLGGQIVDAFVINQGGTFNLFSGDVGDLARVNSGGRVNMSGGTIAAALAVVGGAFQMDGGTIGVDAAVSTLSTGERGKFTITAGEIGDRFRASGYFFQASPTATPVIRTTVVDVLGGTIGNRFLANNASVINISGGTLGDFFTAEKGSAVNLFGSQFAIDGVRIAGLTPDMPLTIDARHVTLSGLLRDGSPFEFQLNTQAGLGDRFDSMSLVTVTLVVPEPAAVPLAIVAMVAAQWFGRLRVHSAMDGPK